MTLIPLRRHDSPVAPRCAIHTLGAALALAVWIGGTGCVTGPAHKLLSRSGQEPQGANANSAAQPLDFGAADVSDQAIDPERQQRSVLFAKARLLEADQQPEQAARLYEGILKAEPKDGAALHRLAVVYAQQGEVEAAEDCFRKALRLDDQNAELHGDYGYFCYLVRRWDDAETHLQRAVELNPSLLAAHNNLGLLAAEQGNIDLAIRHCRDAGCTSEDATHNAALNTHSETPGTAALDEVELAR